MLVSGIDGRIAVVSGAQRGIGLQVCRQLRDLGARVAGLDLAPPDEPGVLGIECDVTSEEAVDAAIGRVEEELGTPTIAVLNAGIYPIVPFQEMTLETWEKTLAVNLTGAFLVARRVIDGMVEQQYGRLVAVGSSAGKAGGAKSVAAYAASKAGIMTLAKSLASEFASQGITSNAVAPALIDTEMISGTLDLIARIPVGRLGKVTEVAALIAFLCSAEAAYITGEVVDINGGFLID